MKFKSGWLDASLTCRVRDRRPDSRRHKGEEDRHDSQKLNYHQNEQKRTRLYRCFRQWHCRRAAGNGTSWSGCRNVKKIQGGWRLMIVAMAPSKGSCRPRCCRKILSLDIVDIRPVGGGVEVKDWHFEPRLGQVFTANLRLLLPLWKVRARASPQRTWTEGWTRALRGLGDGGDIGKFKVERRININMPRVWSHEYKTIYSSHRRVWRNLYVAWSSGIVYAVVYNWLIQYIERHLW